jgi:hypothetical protein
VPSTRNITEDGEAPDKAGEYVEDPTVLEEDDWATFQSWQVPPDKAREQYAGPSRAAERGSSPLQWVWSDGPTWEQVGGAPLQAAPSLFMAGQQAAWDSRPGVLMDTSAGRTRMRGVTVSPSPQSKDEENEKLHELRRYARDFRRQHTTDAERFDWDSDDGDYGLAIGRLVVT